MRRTALAITLATLLPLSTATAQDHPDFSGTWKINMTKSDPPMQGRGGMQQVDMSKIMLTITQTVDALTIAQTGMGRDRTTTYYLDGRESTNPAMRGEMKSTSAWDGTKLVTNGTMTAETPMGTMNMTMKEVRELSADGKTMTISTTTDTPRGRNTRKTVFNKQ